MLYVITIINLLVLYCSRVFFNTVSKLLIAQRALFLTCKFRQVPIFIVTHGWRLYCQAIRPGRLDTLGAQISG